MPQVFVSDEATPDQLRLTARFLQDLAALAEGNPVSGVELPPVLAIPDEEDIAAMSSGAPLTAAEAFGNVPEGTDPYLNGIMRNSPEAPVVIPPPPFVAAVDPTSTLIAPGAPAIPAPTMGTAAVSPASEVKLDKDGLPHDPRIHSVTPTIITTGVWRRRRNLDSPTLVAVEAELRARIAAAPVSLPAAPFIPPPPNKLAAPNAPAPVIPPPPTTAWPAVPADQTTIDPFRQLMRRIDGHTVEGGRLAPDIAKALHVEFGVTGWADYVGVAKGKIPALMLRLDAVLA